MEITRDKDYLGFYAIKMRKENKILTISFGGNGDLYWNLMNVDNFDIQEENFIISKNDGPIYDLFLKLFFSLSNHQIFKVYEEEKRKDNELLDYPYFKDLCNGSYVEWHSDNEPFEIGNILFIRLDSMASKIIINIKRVNRKYDFLTVCFSNSGSRYSPFDLVFYENYRKLCEMDITPTPIENIISFAKKLELNNGQK